MLADEQVSARRYHVVKTKRVRGATRKHAENIESERQETTDIEIVD